MSLFNKWWDAANSKDRVQMAELLDDGFIFVRHNTGEEWNKDKFLDAMMTDVRDKTASEGRRLIYENEKIIVSLLEKCNIEKNRFFEGIKDQKIKDELKNETKEAHDNEIFGAPTFIVNKKIFWGQDRLEFALDEYNKID